MGAGESGDGPAVHYLTIVLILLRLTAYIEEIIM